MSLHATHHGAPLVGPPLQRADGDEEMPTADTGTNDKMGPENLQSGTSKDTEKVMGAATHPPPQGISAGLLHAPDSKAALTFTDPTFLSEMQLQNELMQQNQIPV